MLSKEQFAGVQKQVIKTVDYSGTPLPFSFPEDYGRLFNDIDDLGLFPFSIVELTDGGSDGSWFEAHYYKDGFPYPIIIDGNVNAHASDMKEIVDIYNNIMADIDSFNHDYTITKVV